MKIEKIHEDHRGDIHQFQAGDKECIIVSFEEGKFRGGHYHKNDQWHIIIAGKLLVWTHNIDTGEEKAGMVKMGDSMLIPKNVSHLFLALEPSVMAESRVGGNEATNYEPQRKFV